ncbi:MAG: 30S ribosomal protein S6 [Clostridia bacterium]|nr:30S ribosomal protein S6 [Clostridia bacterium]
MNKYESVVIINPNLEAESIKALIAKFSDLINSNGTVSSVEELGKRRLAYEIKKLNEGYYVVIKFEAKPELIAELERVYRITDEVMKFIVVKEEE